MPFDFSAFGWRDAVLAAAVVAAVYLALLLLRLARLRRPAPLKEPVVAEAVTGEADSAPPAAEPEPPSPAASFGEQLAARIGMEAELQQLRAEVAALRQEVAELKAARRVSPQYADAMDLARRGFDARGIADECGISIGEAELVLAMSRDELNFDEEVDDGGNPRPAEFAGR